MARGARFLFNLAFPNNALMLPDVTTMASNQNGQPNSCQWECGIVGSMHFDFDMSFERKKEKTPRYDWGVKET